MFHLKKLLLLPILFGCTFVVLRNDCLDKGKVQHIVEDSFIGDSIPKDSVLRAYLSMSEFNSPVDVSQRITMFVVNNTGRLYYYGDGGIWVEYYHNMKWGKPLLLPGKTKHPDILVLDNLNVIPPGDTVMLPFFPFWTEAYTYPPGTYRVVKVFGYDNKNWDRKDISKHRIDEYVTAEFKINED